MGDIVVSVSGSFPSVIMHELPVSAGSVKLENQARVSARVCESGGEWVGVSEWVGEGVSE